MGFDSNKQLQKLMNEGLTLQEAASSLGLDIDGADLAMQSMTKREVSLAELVKQYQPRAVRVLMDIVEHGENESARVKACEIIINGKGVLPEMNASQIAERFAMMKRAVAMVEESSRAANIIDIPQNATA